MATSANPIINTGADLISSIPSDILADFASDAPDSTPVDDTPADDEPVEDEAPVDDAPEADDEPATDDEPADETEDEPAADDTQAEPTDELPEGVSKGVDAKGKAEFKLNESRYKTIYGNHQLVQEASKILAEPLTVDALKLRNDAYLGQERLFTSITSGDPTEQGEVIDFFLKEMADAKDNGEVGVDPSVPFAETFYNSLSEKAPDAYARVRLMAARDLVTEMFDAASRGNNPDLFAAAQQFVAQISGVQKDADPAAYAANVAEASKRMGLPFYKPDQMADLAKGEDPVAALRRENAALKQQVSGRNAPDPTAQWKDWDSKHVTTVNSAVFSDAVEPALAAVKADWSKFPDDYKRLVETPLQQEVSKAIRGDQAFNTRISGLKSQAQRAVSEQVRNRIGTDIKNLYVSRAKQAVEALSKPILKFAAESLQGRSDKTHERKTSAQDRTVPKGTGTPVKRSAIPDAVGFKDGVFDSKTAMKQALSLIA